MKAGTKSRIQCGECNTESEVILEPKAVGLPEDEIKKFDENDVTFCAFCGSDSIEVETENEKV